MTPAARGVGGSLFKGKMNSVGGPTMWGHSRVSEELTAEDMMCQAGAQQTRAQDTQAGPAGRGPGGEGARFPSRWPQTAWELPPDFEFESQEERGRGGVGTHLQRQSPARLSQSRAGQAGWDPREESASGPAGSAPVERCGGALDRGHPLGKETPEEQCSTGEPGKPPTLRSLPKERPRTSNHWFSLLKRKKKF